MITKYQDKHLIISNAFGVLDYLYMYFDATLILMLRSIIFQGQTNTKVPSHVCSSTRSL